MSDLRTAAQQALEAMESADFDPHSSDAIYKAITALKAALTEDAMQKFTDVNQELMAALGCDHCNSPLYAAIKCKVCGRVTEPAPPQRKPLTDEEIRAIGESYTDEIWRDDGWSIDFARAIERSHGIVL